MTHIPYKGGPAAISIVSGETQAMLATVGSVLNGIGLQADARPARGVVARAAT